MLLLSSSSILVFNNLLPEIRGFFLYSRIMLSLLSWRFFLTAVPTYFSYRQQFQEHLFFLNQIKIDKTRRPVSEKKS
jgi:hypothetical protein